MEILVGARCKADPFGVLVLCMHEKVVRYEYMYSSVLLDEMGSECER